MSTEVGRKAEQVATDFLQSRGYRVLARNWRTRWCEIDVIVAKGSIIYFVEVKYRSGTAQGFGLDYITSKKLEQMSFAAEFWLAQNQQKDAEYRLAALEVSGLGYSVTAWLDDLQL